MSKNIKKFAAIIGFFMLFTVGLAGFYSAVLPDSCYVYKDEQFVENTLFPITVKKCESQFTQAISSSDYSDSSQSTLLLFNSVPIKNVSTDSQTRPNLIPCGQPFGIKLLTEGAMVVDFSDIDGSCPAKEAGIKEGDMIIEANGTKITSNSDLSNVISNCGGQPCTIRLKRDGDEKEVKIYPVLSEGRYKAGIWVRDSSAGIGTLTFFDPQTNSFGGLGHGVCDSETKQILPLSEGAVGEITITGFTKSKKGNPGQLLGEFSNNACLGKISLNCSQGVFGSLAVNPSENQAVELAFNQEVHTGQAQIICSIDGTTQKYYSISIEQVNLSEKSEHDLVIKITDPLLLSQTGGILQGMSGSPIIQDGRLVGAVTHVFIDDPSMGYGIFAEKMYDCMCEQTEIKKAG